MEYAEKSDTGDGFLLSAEVRPIVEERMQENKVGSERNNVSYSVQSC